MAAAEVRCAIEACPQTLEQVHALLAMLADLPQASVLKQRAARKQQWHDGAQDKVRQAQELLRQAWAAVMGDAHSLSHTNTHTLAEGPAASPSLPAAARQLWVNARGLLCSVFGEGSLGEDSEHAAPQAAELRELDARIAESACKEEGTGERWLQEARGLLEEGRFDAAREAERACKMCFVRAGVERERQGDLQELSEAIGSAEEAAANLAVVLPQVAESLKAKLVLEAEALLQEATDRVQQTHFENELSPLQRLGAGANRLRRVMDTTRSRALQEAQVRMQHLEALISNGAIGDAEQALSELERSFATILAASHMPQLAELREQMKSVSQKLVETIGDKVQLCRGYVDCGNLILAKQVLQEAEAARCAAPRGHRAHVHQHALSSLRIMIAQVDEGMSRATKRLSKAYLLVCKDSSAVSLPPCVLPLFRCLIHSLAVRLKETCARHSDTCARRRPRSSTRHKQASAFSSLVLR